MYQLLTQSDFWVPAFSFLASLIASIVGLLKYSSLLKNRLEIKKFNFNNQTEKLRSEYTAQTIASLQATIASILPELTEHNKAIQEGNKALSTISQTVNLAQIANAESKKMMENLVHQHESFNLRMAQVQKGGELVVSRLLQIETEVLELKSGNVFIRTKRRE